MPLEKMAMFPQLYTVKDQNQKISISKKLLAVLFEKKTLSSIINLKVDGIANVYLER